LLEVLALNWYNGITMSDTLIKLPARPSMFFGGQPAGHDVMTAGHPVSDFGQYYSRGYAGNDLRSGSVQLGDLGATNIVPAPWEPPQRIVGRFHLPVGCWPDEPDESASVFEEAFIAGVMPRFRWGKILGKDLSANRGTSLSESLAVLLLGLSRLISPELMGKAKELLSLEQGWDGESAKPVRVEALAKALMLLRLLKLAHQSFTLPFVAPTFDGFLLLDWSSPRRTLEVQVESIFLPKPIRANRVFSSTMSGSEMSI
jgi:hypothetical protein